MKIKNISKIPIEVYDGNRFTRIMPGETQDVDGAVVRRRKLIERGLVVSDEPEKQKPVVEQPVPAYKAHTRAKLDEADA